MNTNFQYSTDFRTALQQCFNLAASIPQHPTLSQDYLDDMKRVEVKLVSLADLIDAGYFGELPNDSYTQDDFDADFPRVLAEVQRVKCLWQQHEKEFKQMARTKQQSVIRRFLYDVLLFRRISRL
jgi:hypothetical protein